MKLHEKLYKLRKSKGLTQAELAEQLDVSRQSVSNWELGTIQPSTSRLKKLSKLYSVPLEILLDDDAEIQHHSEYVEVAARENAENRNVEIIDFSQKESCQKKCSMRKTLVIIVLGIMLALLIGISIYCIATNNSEKEPTRLDQLGNEEVTISSGNGFDFQ